MKLPRLFKDKKEEVKITPMKSVKSAWWEPLVSSAYEYDFGDGVIYSLKMAQGHKLITFYEAVSPVNGALTRLAGAVSGIPIMLVDKNSNTRVKKHPLLDLLEKPNNHFQKTKRDLFRDLTIWKILEGDAFLVATGNPSRPPLELYVMNPMSMQIETQGTGYIQKIHYSPNSTGADVYTVDGKGRFISADKQRELFHIANFTTRPESAQDGGLSELSPLYYEIQQYVLASVFNAAMLRNGGRPSGFLVWDGDGAPTEDALMRLREDIRGSYQGANNAGNIPLLVGVKWEEASVNPKDGDFRGIKKDAEEQIYKTLGVPIDLTGSSSVSANNMVNIRREFYQSRVVPFMEDLLAFMNTRLLPRYSENNLELRVDRENIDVFTEERAQKLKIIENSTTMTINEKRQTLGLPPIDHGNKIVDPNGRPIAGPDADGEIGFTANSSQTSGIVKEDPLLEPSSPKITE